MTRVQAVVSWTFLAAVPLGVAHLHAQTQNTSAGQATAPQVRTARDISMPTNPIGTGSISGRIVDQTGAPMRHALVTVSGIQLGLGGVTYTDDNGDYAVAALAPGVYTVSVTKPGFPTAIYGQRNIFGAGAVIELEDGQHVNAVDIAAHRGAIISGRVVDEFREGVADVSVTLQRIGVIEGQRRFVSVGASVTTNDLGEFRFAGLEADSYFLSATPKTLPMDPGRVRQGYGRTYYPGTLDSARALPLTVVPGDMLTSIELPIASAQLATVSGIVVNGEMLVRSGGVVVMDLDGRSVGVRSAAIRPDGSFTVVGTPPGRYILQSTIQAQPTDARVTTRPGPIASPPTIAFATIDVAGRDIPGVIVRTPRTVTLSGRVTSDSTTAAGPTGKVSISASARWPTYTGLVATADVNEDLSFSLTLPATRVAIRTTIRDVAWGVTSIRIGGRDITDTIVDLSNIGGTEAVEIEITNRPPRLSGRLTNSAGQPVPGASLIVFPQDRDRWLPGTRSVTIVQSSEDGRYLVRGIPAGSYFAVAVDSFSATRLSDVRVFDSLRLRAATFNLGEHENKTSDFIVSR